MSQLDTQNDTFKLRVRVTEKAPNADPLAHAQTPTIEMPGCSLLFGAHSESRDIHWRCEKLEQVVHARRLAPRHILLMEAAGTSTLHSSADKVQEFYDNLVREQPERFPERNWNEILRAPVPEGAELQFLKQLLEYGSHKMREFEDGDPTASKELALRGKQPDWTPIAATVATLRERGVDVSVKFERSPLPVFVRRLNSSLVEADLNQALGNFDLQSAVDLQLYLEGLQCKDDIERDEELVVQMRELLRLDPDTHVIVERGTAHWANLTSILRREAIPYSEHRQDGITEFRELREPRFWADADTAPSPEQRAEAIRNLLFGLSTTSSTDEERKSCYKSLREIPDRILIESESAAANVLRLAKPTDQKESHEFIVRVVAIEIERRGYSLS